MGLRGIISSLALGAGFQALLSNMKEAEEAASKLDSAFANTGKTVGLTRSQLDGLATEIQRTTTLSDDLVKEAQAILLSFDQVRGQAFERTTKVAADLSARLGTDLKSAIKQVGLALQDPIAGLTILRRSGIAFSDSQKNLIKNLLDTGQAAKAQNVILTELERRFGGAAAAARNTLGGAIAGLKNAFGDLFEGTRESTSGIVKSINGISDALSDPAIKEGIDTIITGFTKLIELLIRGVGAIGKFEQAIQEFATKQGPTASALRGLLASIPGLSPLALGAEALANSSDRRTRGPTGAQRGRGLQGSGTEGVAPILLEEVRIINAAKIELGAYRDLLDEISESTKTSTEKQISAYNKLKEELKLLRQEGRITQVQQEARLSEGLDELLPEINISAIRNLYKPIRKETTELGEFMKGVWQQVGRSIQSTLSDALYEWKLSWKSLLDVARRALADITAAIITSGIKNALKNATSGSGSSGGGVNWLSAIAGFFGFAAGGGRTDGPTIVGENGPEVVMGTNKVMNQRQMAFAGGGNVNYSPSFSIAIVERDNPEKTKQEVYQTIAVMMAQDKAEFVRTLERSGYQVRG